MTNQELGQLGENLACKYLSEKLYDIKCRNFRFGHLEADIICEAGGKLIVVEVKTRQTTEIGEPWEAVTKSKQRQIIKVANHYIAENDVQLETRFDVISIIHRSSQAEIQHIEDAFSPVL